MITTAPDTDTLSLSERREVASLLAEIRSLAGDRFTPEDTSDFFNFVKEKMKENRYSHDDKGLCVPVQTLKTAIAFAEYIDPDRNILLAICLEPLLHYNLADIMDIRRRWGSDVASLLVGAESVAKFSSLNNVANQENFRGLMLSLADDIRVIIMMIVKNLVLMRSINLHPDEDWVRNVAFEANCLYAQLAHRLGLYKIKGELEDLALKYTNREIFTQIAHKLNETKRSRDAYIKNFIDPVKEKLEAAGLKFEIKGRTKSISSIWGKMQKQKVDIQGIYDLFAIRVIIDTPREREKSDCWLAYSILADMYTANPARMRDWITIPKSNGYESLHATLMGPENKWVEVQFRTRRMDLVAEKGLAAHWRYKGVKGDSTDQWMNNIRDILETADAGPMQLMRDMKMDIYNKEVFVFTPKGDLFRLPVGATVLDFAFLIHSEVGSHCNGAVVNGRHRKITHRLESGDTVEILTSVSQTPKTEWLNIVSSTKARNKIKQKLNEEKQRQADIGKETLSRRAKNRKIELDETELTRLIKKEGYKYITDFFADIATDKLDAGKVLSKYLEFITPTDEYDDNHVSAGDFKLRQEEETSPDMLIIGDKNINGLSYKMAKCCNPIYGDNVFGFISSDGMVKVHKHDCPNAANIRSRYPYRLIRVNWSGKTGGELPATLRIVGNDDIGIVANITSLISKEPGVILRNISIDSNDGIFQGFLVVGVSGERELKLLMKKLSGIKGVKNVTR